MLTVVQWLRRTISTFTSIFYDKLLQTITQWWQLFVFCSRASVTHRGRKETDQKLPGPQRGAEVSRLAGWRRDAGGMPPPPHSPCLKKRERERDIDELKMVRWVHVDGKTRDGPTPHSVWKKLGNQMVYQLNRQFYFFIFNFCLSFNPGIGKLFL